MLTVHAILHAEPHSALVKFAIAALLGRTDREVRARRACRLRHR